MTMTTGIPGAQPRDPGSTPRPRPSAVVWINGREAVIAATDIDGMIMLSTVERGIRSEGEYLATVVRRIGDRERVMILGPGSTRIALERAYVAINRRPDRLIDVEPAGAIDEEDLVERVRVLAA
ncbi:MAG TPA: hypothetical protein VK867_05385 [Candidatus Limnocylindrales bacterium]|nr:hypothetical protein [Candidatus Limnocylindrales bacterium]